MKKVKTRINTRKLVKDFGGAVAVSRGLTEVGLPITKDAIHKWYGRGKCPAEYLFAFAQIAKERNQRFELLDYI